jgi:uncharacterized membrane protein YfcA
VLDAGPLAIVAGALFLGSFLNSLVGFGFALVTVPLMALAVGPKEAVVLSAMYGLLSNGGVALRHRGDAEVPVVRRLFIGGLVGMPVGLALLVVVPAAPLQVAISVTVLVSVVVLARGWVIEDPHPAVDLGAGLCSGILNTSVGVSGPPIVMDLHGRGLPKGPFRASAAAYFGLAGVVALVLFAVVGRLDLELAVAAALALPAWPLGAWAGERVHHAFPDDRFRGLVLGLLGLTAVVTLLAAAGG